MANTYTSLHYHVVFSTKNRISWIKPNLESRIWRFIGGIAREHKMTAMQVGGCDDHVKNYSRYALNADETSALPVAS